MAEQGFTLTSPDFVPDSLYPSGSTCDGPNNSPALEWMHPPEGTQSYALILEDPDAPNGTFVHWLLFDLPGDARQLSAAAKAIGVSGRNDFQQVGYGGPCPPPNHGYHRYFFRLFALDIPSLKLKEGVRRAELEDAMENHVLGEAQLMGRYKRAAG